MKQYTFRVIIEPEHPRGYHGFVPILKGVHTYGDTMGKVKRNLREAILCHIQGLARDREKIPQEEDTFELIQSFSERDLAVVSRWLFCAEVAHRKTKKCHPSFEETRIFQVPSDRESRAVQASGRKTNNYSDPPRERCEKENAPRHHRRYRLDCRTVYNVIQKLGWIFPYKTFPNPNSRSK